jgi:hypothetical protein
VTLTARAVSGNSYAFLAARHQPAELTEDGRGHFLAQPQDFGFAFWCEPLGVQLKRLQREQMFHDLFHGALSCKGHADEDCGCVKPLL